MAAKLAAEIRESIGRFPLTVAFAVVLTVTGIVLNHADGAVSNRVQFFLYWFLITGMMLSTGLAMMKRPAVTAVSLVVWAAVWVAMSRYSDVIQKQPYVLTFAALITLSVLSVVLLPFMGQKDDRPMWNFTLRLAGTVCVSLFVGLVLWGGLSLLLLSLEHLFGFDVNSDLYEDMACICFFLVSPVLILQGILHSAPVSVPAFVRNAVTYLFIPLTGLYFITLYSYAVRILVTWELPQGWVSYLVSASMILVVLLRTALHRPDGYPSFAVRLVNGLMPVLMLPLLVLMSVGIARRIIDYGITVSRVYLIIFNLWCYAACIIMRFRKDSGVMWMPVSVALLFIVLSVFPVSVSTSVRSCMLRQVRSVMTASDWDGTPMSDQEYGVWLAGLDRETALKVDSKLDYLKSRYRCDVTGLLVAPDALTGGMEKEKSDALYLSGYRLNNGNMELAVPEGMTAAVPYENHSNIDDLEMTEDSVRARFPLDAQLSFELAIPMSDLRAISNDCRDIADLYDGSLPCYRGVLSDGRPCVFYLDYFYLRSDLEGRSMNVSGLLFCTSGDCPHLCNVTL